MKARRIGQMTIQRVAEFPSVPVEPTRLFPGATPEIVARGRKTLDHRFIDRERDILVMAIQSFVLQVGERNILIDACNGNDKERGPHHYAHRLTTDWLGDLARAGLRPEDIDLVLCTHLHNDHTGWNTRLKDGKWVPTFPKAKYLISRLDFDFVGNLPPDRPEADLCLASYQDSVLPVVAAGQAELIETDHVVGRELDRGIWMESCPGHTPGTMLIHAESGGRRALFSGDVIHHPIQIIAPSLHIEGEYDTPEATRSRQHMLEDAADRDLTLFPAHFADPVAARVVSRGGALGFDFDGA